MQNIPANASNRRFSQPIPARTEDRRSIYETQKEPSQHQRKAEVNLRVLLLQCLWRGEIEKKRWSPVRRHKRTRTRTTATSSHLVSPAQPSTIFVPRIEVSREPFPCPVATRAIAVRPRSVEKTELFWHSPRIFFLFSNRRGAPPRRPVAARKLPPRASSVRRLGPDVSSLPSRGIRDRAPGVDETRTHLGSGSGRKGSKLVGARLLNNTRLPRLDRDRALTRPIEHVD